VREIDIDLKRILLNRQNNYVGNLKKIYNDKNIIILYTNFILLYAAKNFDILAISLSILHNYFDCLTKFSNLYLAKFLDILIKPFFPRGNTIKRLPSILINFGNRQK